MSGWVLAVEDDEDLRFILASMLEDDGHEVVEAENGAVALERIGGRSAPCAIVLDLMMPVMSGTEFLVRRMSEPSIAAVPVIVITGGSDYEQKLQGLHVDRVFRKPFAPRALLDVVESFCPRARWPTPPASAADVKDE